MQKLHLLKSEDFYFWKGISLTVIFFLITPIVIGISLLSLYSLHTPFQTSNKTKSGVLGETYLPNNNLAVYSASDDGSTQATSIIEPSDGRAELLRQYLKYYHSPLETYAQKFVTEADKNFLDYRLLVAIAQQESNLCKLSPPDSFNCWGWGIHSEGTLKFKSYNEAIEVVSNGIKLNYVDEGLNTIDTIMSRYTPLSNGSWAYGVEKFMDDIENF